MQVILMISSTYIPVQSAIYLCRIFCVGYVDIIHHSDQHGNVSSSQI